VTGFPGTNAPFLNLNRQSLDFVVASGANANKGNPFVLALLITASCGAIINVYLLAESIDPFLVMNKYCIATAIFPTKGIVATPDFAIPKGGLDSSQHLYFTGQITIVNVPELWKNAISMAASQ
jgi:hypothetical protein